MHTMRTSVPKIYKKSRPFMMMKLKLLVILKELVGARAGLEL